MSPKAMYNIIRRQLAGRERRRTMLLAAAGMSALTAACITLVPPAAGQQSANTPIIAEDGSNPDPVVLWRRENQPLSALAEIGKSMFYDASLSASGKQSCASCHSPGHDFGPPLPVQDVQTGGIAMDRQGLRPPPSLTYAGRAPQFSIGPSDDDSRRMRARPRAPAGAAESNGSGALATGSAADVPVGGLFWDGRANTFMEQAAGPLLSPNEMANASVEEFAQRLLRTPYAKDFAAIFGPAVLESLELLYSEALSALSVYQVEAREFHRFDSKYDLWLEGKLRLSAAERRGLLLFGDPAKGNCAECHIARPNADGVPPVFTDYEYAALGVPRNRRIAVNADPAFYDLGLCGPLRKNLSDRQQYCGMFRTPSLRNAARRGVYFHNGVYHDLCEVLAFYNLRSAQPGRIYPLIGGKPALYDDLPARYHGNVNVADAPFAAKPGSTPPLTDQDMADIIAFLATLNDGYQPQ